MVVSSSVDIDVVSDVILLKEADDKVVDVCFTVIVVVIFGFEVVVVISIMFRQRSKSDLSSSVVVFFVVTVLYVVDSSFSVMRGSMINSMFQYCWSNLSDLFAPKQALSVVGLLVEQDDYQFLKVSKLTCVFYISLPLGLSCIWLKAIMIRQRVKMSRARRATTVKQEVLFR